MNVVKWGHIKPGMKFVISRSGWGSRLQREVKVCKRLTKTLIITEDDMRYNMMTGCRTPRNNFYYNYIQSANADDVKEVEEHRKQKRRRDFIMKRVTQEVHEISDNAVDQIYEILKKDKENGSG